MERKADARGGARPVKQPIDRCITQKSIDPTLDRLQKGACGAACEGQGESAWDGTGMGTYKNEKEPPHHSSGRSSLSVVAEAEAAKPSKEQRTRGRIPGPINLLLFATAYYTRKKSIDQSCQSMPSCL